MALALVQPPDIDAGHGPVVTKPGGRLCFHHRARCGFCGLPRSAPARARLRCPCCGRFVKQPLAPAGPVRCPVCRTAGYVALTLFV